jgi:hypothetical protein
MVLAARILPNPNQNVPEVTFSARLKVRDFIPAFSREMDENGANLRLMAVLLCQKH